MTTGSLGFGRPEYSRPAGIEQAGREFMQAVFAMKPGETGVAPNNSKSRVYVVRVLSQEPDDEKLQQQFIDSGYNQLVLMLAQSETMYTSVQWWRGIEDQYQVQWQRTAANARYGSDVKPEIHDAGESLVTRHWQVAAMFCFGGRIHFD